MKLHFRVLALAAVLLTAYISRGADVITVTATPPNVGMVSGGGSYANGENVMVTAEATNECYYFERWVANGKTLSTNAPYTFTAEHSERITALFAPYRYNIETSNQPPRAGTITGGGIKECGEAVRVVAHARAGFGFLNWTEEAAVVSTNPSYELTASSNTVLTANYKDISPPTVAITTPTANERTTNTMVQVAGRASDNVGVTGVYYQVNAGGWQAAELTSGGTRWSASVSLILGTNDIQVYAVDGAGNNSKVEAVTVIREPTATIVQMVSQFITHPQGQIAFDGTNYLVVYQSHPTEDQPEVLGQLVSPTGDPVGEPMNLNPTGGGDPPCEAFGAGNYLVGWYESSSQMTTIVGALVSPNGSVGSASQLVQSQTVDDFGSIAYGGGVYLLVWSDNRDETSSSGSDDLFGAIIDTNGNPVVPDFEIASNAKEDEAGQSAVAFDGTNFLAVWHSDVGKAKVSGAFINPTGTIGTPFVIYENSASAGAPYVAVTFGGSNYLVMFSYEAGGAFHSAGRLVSPAGEVLSNQIAIGSGSGAGAIIPCAAYDGSDYLITWNQGYNPLTSAGIGTVDAALYGASGKQIPAPAVLLKGPAGKTATWAPVLFDGSQFVGVGGYGSALKGHDNGFTNGAIDLLFVQP